MKRLLTALLASAAALAARADILPGLEAYGDLTLVDEIECATDTAHEFHEYPDGASYVTNIFGSACRAMAHPAGSAGYLSYRLGAGLGLVPHDMYLLVAEYPEDVPRTVTLINKAMDSRNGFYTGKATGQSLSGGVLAQVHPESVGVPLSGAWSRLAEVMVLNEYVYDYKSTSTLLTSATDGFDAVFQLFKAANAPDSAGIALRSIKLYRMNDEAGIASTDHYPAGDTPRRFMTWREEMSVWYAADKANDDRYDDARHKTRLMRALGLNCYSRTMLEFGYNKSWAGGWKPDVLPSWWNNEWGGGGYWSSSAPSDTWTDEVAVYGASGLYLLPYYEYAGSRGSWGPYEDANGKTGKALGFSEARASVPLLYDTGILGSNTNRINCFVQASNGASSSNVDITQEPAYDDFTRILGCTILRYADQANFVGAWIRTRGSMPVSFSDAAIAKFCEETGRAPGAVTRASIVESFGKAAGEVYRDTVKYGNNRWTDIYREYRQWWYGKRAQWLEAMQDLLDQNGVPGAKVFYTGEMGEASLTLHAPVGNDTDRTSDGCGAVQLLDSDWSYGGRATRAGAWMAQTIRDYALTVDGWSWYPFEYNHAEPQRDPYTYTNRNDVAITFPYDTVCSVIAGGKDFRNALNTTYRNASGDLFMTRFYCLHEGMNPDASGNENNGYFTTEMDHAGRAIMLPELFGFVYQDPTVVGMLQGNPIARAFSAEFREFADNFTALPAKEGTVVDGADGWSSMFVVRRYEGAGETFFAVANATGTAKPAQSVNLKDASIATLYEAVSGRAHPVSGGILTLDVKPYQLLSFSTRAPETPRFTVAVPTVGSKTADIPLDVSTLGGETADRTVTCSLSSDFSDPIVRDTATCIESGTNVVSLTGLRPLTTYWVSVGLTNALGNGSARLVSFTTGSPSEWPVAAIEAEAVRTNAIVQVNLTALGDGAAWCDLYATAVPATAGLATATSATVRRTATGAFEMSVGPLSSETTYGITLYGSNGIVSDVALAVATVTTPKPVAAEGEGIHMPGLLQAKFTTRSDLASDIRTAEGVAVVPGAIMSTTTNSYAHAGATYSWGSDMTYAYLGEMWMEGGTKYIFGKYFDDDGYLVVDGNVLINNTGWDKFVTKDYTPAETGWHTFELRLGNGSGGVGPKDFANGYLGIGYNTQGKTGTFKADNGWHEIMLGDGDTKLRCEVSTPVLVSLGSLSQAGSTVIAPVSIDSYDEDNVLTVYATTTAPDEDEFAEPTAIAHDFGGWTAVPGGTPAIGAGQTRTVAIENLSLKNGDTVYVVARLANERTGYDVVTAVSSLVIVGDNVDTAPTFSAEVASVSPFSATISVNVSNLGQGSGSATITVQVGGKTETVQISATGISPFAFSGLAAGTAYTATVTATGSNGLSETKTVSFTTADAVAPSGSVSVSDVGFENATATVTVASKGDEPGAVSITLEVATDAAFSTIVKTLTGASPFSLSGLADGTTYYVRAVLTGETTGLAGTTEAVAFTTAAYGAPALGDVAVAATHKALSFSVPVSSLGTGAGAATVSLTLGGVTKTAAASVGNAATFVFENLDPATDYSWSVALENDKGKTAAASGTARTRAFPIALGTPTADVADDGASATLRVAVTGFDADEPGTLSLGIDGVEAATWSVAAAGTFEKTLAVAAGEHTFVFTAVAGGETVAAEGSFRAVAYKGWFHVDLSDAGYAAFPDVSGVAAPGGTWTLGAGVTATYSAESRTIAYAAADGAEGDAARLRYVPTAPTARGADAKVEGTLRAAPWHGAPDAPADALAGVAFVRDGSTAAARVLAGGAWVAHPATAEEGADVAWKAEFDFSSAAKPRVRYTVAGVADDWHPLAAAERLERVEYVGAGAFGSFQGSYAVLGAVELPDRVTFAADGTGLALNPAAGTLTLVIADAVEGVYYTVFSADSLQGTYTAVAGSAAAASNGRLTFENIAMDAPAKFLKVVASDTPFAAGDPLP